MIVVVMGVSGCGKSSVGQAIALRSGWTFIEGDDLHPVTNREKMASGEPLNDDDRWPWLDVIVEIASDISLDGRSAVVACSALKQSYRERLRLVDGAIAFVHLSGTRDMIDHRLQSRSDHFMPPGLLNSQLATLEDPSDEEDVITIDITAPIDDIAKRAVAALSAR